MLRHHMRIGGADADRGARGDAITAIFEILERAARKARHRGHEPQRFLERPFGHFELAEAVVPDALTRRRDAQHLLAQPVLPFGMAREFPDQRGDRAGDRSEEHTSELQSLMRISYAVFCLKKKNKQEVNITDIYTT